MKFNIIILSGIILILTGCASTIDAVHTKEFTMGCAVIEANAKLGAFNQEGQAEACKLICSKELPTGFRYQYESRGCKVVIGN